MIDHEDWDPSTFEGTYTRHPAAHTSEPYEKPERWYRDNAAVFHALEQWQANWDAHAEEYEHTNGRPPSTMARQKNRAEFQRTLMAAYGRREPDAQWLDQRTGHLEKRGMAPERGDGGRR